MRITVQCPSLWSLSEFVKVGTGQIARPAPGLKELRGAQETVNSHPSAPVTVTQGGAKASPLLFSVNLSGKMTGATVP